MKPAYTEDASKRVSIAPIEAVASGASRRQSFEPAGSVTQRTSLNSPPLNTKSLDKGPRPRFKPENGQENLLMEKKMH